MNLRSHTIDELKKALGGGERIWSLDTGNDGEDDVLYGHANEILHDVLRHHELDELPEHWSLRSEHA